MHRETFHARSSGQRHGNAGNHLSWWLSFGEFVELLRRLPRPDDKFADDLEAIHASQEMIGDKTPWDD